MMRQNAGEPYVNFAYKQQDHFYTWKAINLLGKIFQTFKLQKPCYNLGKIL